MMTDPRNDFQTIRWDAQGRPHWLQNGQAYYIPPSTAAQMVANGTRDPRLAQWVQAMGASPSASNAPGQSLFRTRGTWNPQSGQWDQGINWSNIASMAAGGLMAAPALAAVGGGASTGAGAGGWKSSLAAAAGSGGGGGGGGTLGAFLTSSAFGTGIDAVTKIYSAGKQASAANRAAQLEADAANRAADLHAKAAADQLAFAKEQEATRRAEWQSTQDRNYGIYQEERDFTRAQRAPFIRMGHGTIGQLMRPIPGSGTIGDLLRRG